MDQSSTSDTSTKPGFALASYLIFFPKKAAAKFYNDI